MNSLNNLLDLNYYKNHTFVALTGCDSLDNNNIFNKILNYSKFDIYSDIFFPNTNLHYNLKEYNIINLPPTSTLFDLPGNKILTRDFICFFNPKCIIVVSNELNLVENLELLFQIMEINKNIIFCINLTTTYNDTILDIDLLEYELGIPIILNKKNEFDTNLLLKTLDNVIFNDSINKSKYVLYDCNIESVITCFSSMLQQSVKSINPRWLALRIIDNDQSFFNSMYNYLDEPSISKFNIIRSFFPKTLDPFRIKSNLNNRIHQYCLYLKDKICVIE